jgi:alpha-L-fucosidase
MGILAEITAWMAVNSEGIHGTRPWQICGEGPSLEGAVRDTSAFKLLPAIPDTSPGATRSAGSPDSGHQPFTAQDVRFTAKGDALYAFVMLWPESRAAMIKSLASNLPLVAGRKVTKVSLLGYGGKLEWSQTTDGLAVKLPEKAPGEHAVTLRIKGLLA